MPKFDFVSPGAAATNELTKIMAEREAKKRQDMLDAITQQTASRNDQIQRANLSMMEDQKAQALEKAKQDSAAQVLNVAGVEPGADITGNKPVIDAAKVFGLYKPPVSNVKDVPTDQGPNPLVPGMMGVREQGSIAPETIAPTAAQRKDAEHKAAMKGLATKLATVTDRKEATRLVLDAEVPPAQVDDVVNAYMGKATPAPAGTAGEFLFSKGLPTDTVLTPALQAEFEKYQNTDANRHRPITTNNFSGVGTGPNGTNTGAAANLDEDVQAVLEGRNTLGSIRMNIGRSNQAAAYMAEMRKRITKDDPQFDFIASDAGGKSVSTPYVQRATAAIKAVLPNIDKIIDLSNQVSRVGVNAVDNLIQKGAIQFGNQKITTLHQAQKLLSDEIGVALGAGNVSDMKLKLGYDVTDPNVPADNFAQNMETIKEFVQNRQHGLDLLRYHSKTVDPVAPDAGAAPPAAGAVPGETPAARSARLRKAAGL